VKVDFYLLDLKKFIKDPLINNNTIKADILMAKFFLKTRIVDFNNIKVEAIMEQRAFNISPTILIEKFNKLIKSFLNRKILGLNDILNKVFKIVILVIAKNLIKAASYCFINKIILKNLKFFIIVVLYKKEKKNYSLLGSYKLITFKNTLVKVLKKYIANIISKATEKYKFFFGTR